MVDTIICALEAPQVDAWHEALLDAAFLFEKASLPRGECTVEEFAARMGWPSSVVHAVVGYHEVDRLKTALVRFIERHPDGPHAVSAIWALGKVIGDRTLLPIFIRMLRCSHERNPELVYQILIALRNLGEEVFPSPGGASFLDVDRNRDLARDYLRRLDIPE
ncbi:MAG TPA: hypothetical protein VK689_07880 [Armatimonadota bacterium]|nr:hypothetical protein [Armatimonadota bacterium]